jgi:NADPH:quinone reductase-like Zn-dependent oxidoreductase
MSGLRCEGRPCLIPDCVDDVSAAGIPVAYVTAKVALTLAGFRAGKTVLAPAIGGSVGNAVTQLARALGAKTRHLKHDQPCESRAGEGARIQ